MLGYEVYTKRHVLSCRFVPDGSLAYSVAIPTAKPPPPFPVSRTCTLLTLCRQLEGGFFKISPSYLQHVTVVFVALSLNNLGFVDR